MTNQQPYSSKFGALINNNDGCVRNIQQKAPFGFKLRRFNLKVT